MLSVPNPVLSTALARATHPVLLSDGGTLTAQQLRADVAMRAAGLSQRGIRPGSVVALLGPANANWVVAYHAIGWIGATAAPLPDGVTKRELDVLLEQVRPDAIVTSGVPLADASAPIESIPLQEIRAEDAASIPQERFWPLEEVRAIIFTSGTTGTPRKVELTTAQLLFSAFGSAIRLGHDLHDRWLACLPLHHIGGLSIITRCALMGTCVVLHERFDAERVAHELDRGEVTLVSLVPTMLERVLDARPEVAFPSSLRAILVGGAAMPPGLFERCRAIGAPLSVTWGMTESASQVATRLSGDFNSDGSSGSPLPFARVETMDGALVVRGPLIRGGLIATGDLGSVDGEGRVHVSGRLDDVVISGGEMIAPAEVEAILGTHPGIADVAVIGQPDRQWGERPVAFVVARQQPISESELVSWCRERLSAFKVPDSFVWCDHLPRGDNGKLSRRLLRELAAHQRPESEADGRAAAGRNGRSGQPSDYAMLNRLAVGSSTDHIQRLGRELAELHQWLGGDLAAIERQIDALSTDDHDLAQRAAAHLLAQPGKRVRPLCVLLAARLGGATPDEQTSARLTDLGIACELVHAATLLHDDVIDLGTERRGAPAARTLFGNTASILAGDHLLTEALRKVTTSGSAALLDSLLDTIKQMIAAEALQLEQQRRFDPRPELYLRIVQGKTASLFRWALQAGAAVAELPLESIGQAGRFGECLGVAFQLTDDLLDFDGDPQRVGKDTLADLREGKLTWPLLVAARRDPGLAADLRLATAEKFDQVTVEQLVNRILATGALPTTRGATNEYAQQARDALAHFPDGRARRALDAVITFCVARTS